VSAGKKRLEKMRSAVSDGHTAVFPVPGSREEAKLVLRKALSAASRRGDVVIPQESLSWKKLLTLSIAGGIVPCPDALAILLLAISLGHIVLGMSIVLFFSIGLSAALITFGVIIVLSKSLVSGRGWFAGLSRFIPYASSAFIAGLGIFMIANQFI
jgi:ABC-type nickel/cobalt efflux system permease component RcnA